MENLSENAREIKEGLDFGFALQDAYLKADEDGNIDEKDITVLFPVIATAKDAFTGLGNPIERYRNLSEEEHDLILDYVRDRFDLPDDVLEILIEDTLMSAMDVVRITKRWIQFVK